MNPMAGTGNVQFSDIVNRVSSQEEPHSQVMASLLSGFRRHLATLSIDFILTEEASPDQKEHRFGCAGEIEPILSDTNRGFLASAIDHLQRRLYDEFQQPLEEATSETKLSDYDLRVWIFGIRIEGDQSVKFRLGVGMRAIRGEFVFDSFPGVSINLLDYNLHSTRLTAADILRQCMAPRKPVTFE